MDDFEDIPTDDLFGDPDVAVREPEPTDPALALLQRVNALKPSEAVTVVDVALGNHVDDSAMKGSTEMGELLAIVREFGVGALQSRAEAAPVAAVEPIDFGRLSADDFERVTEAVLSESLLPYGDPLAALVDAQIAGAQAVRGE